MIIYSKSAHKIYGSVCLHLFQTNTVRHFVQEIQFATAFSDTVCYFKYHSDFKLFNLKLLNADINPLNPELNPICYLLALLAHHFLHVSRIRVKSLTPRLLMSYIYGAPNLDVSRSHTTTQHSR